MTFHFDIYDICQYIILTIRNALGAPVRKKSPVPTNWLELRSVTNNDVIFDMNVGTPESWFCDRSKYSTSDICQNDMPSEGHSYRDIWHRSESYLVSDDMCQTDSLDRSPKHSGTSPDRLFSLTLRIDICPREHIDVGIFPEKKLISNRRAKRLTLLLRLGIYNESDGESWSYVYLTSPVSRLDDRSRNARLTLKLNADGDTCPLNRLLCTSMNVADAGNCGNWPYSSFELKS